jgi:hypothetical protein
MVEAVDFNGRTPKGKQSSTPQLYRVLKDI